MTAADVITEDEYHEVMIEAPGVYDIPEAAYHADPVPGGSLSASGAKLLLPPSCPARYQHDRLNPPPPKDTFDLGSAAHRLVLDAGLPICRLSYDNWRTGPAREARDEARKQGYIPVLEPDFQRIAAMAGAIHVHPQAGALLNPERGTPEQSLFWIDEDTGIWRRARLDFMRDRIVVDYKTCDKADRESVRKAIANYGYYIQAAQYTGGVRALGLDDDPAFVFIFQEKNPPYLVNVVQLDDEAMEAGRQRMRRACEMFRDCTASGIWPGYCDYDRDPDTISLPPWVARPLEDS